MRRVVYLLGAGFSAELGLPVMANFLEKAKDQYYGTDDRYQHFAAVLETIAGMHVANSYYRTDVSNIEDILSILDMQGRLAGNDQQESFTQFLSDVIEYHTPAPGPLATAPQNWLDSFFWPRPWQAYGPFVAALLGYELRRPDAFDPSAPGRPAYSCHLATAQAASYSVITLNYDLVLETAAKFLTTRYRATRGFARSDGTQGTPLVKLHGSIDTKDIVPPTWSKTLSPPTIRAAWESAYRLLGQANDIRIIGYSLPESDAYIRYLLRAAAIAAPNLKRVHVVCRDPKGEVAARYNQFVTFRNYRFQPVDTNAYLSRIIGITEQWPVLVSPDKLEAVHDDIFPREA